MAGMVTNKAERFINAITSARSTRIRRSKTEHGIIVNIQFPGVRAEVGCAVRLPWFRRQPVAAKPTRAIAAAGVPGEGP